MRYAVASLLVLLMVALSTHAADAPKGPGGNGKVNPKALELLKSTPEEFIKRFDKNGDGVLTKDEVPPQMADHFDKIDKNGDGKLDRQEVAALLEFLRARMKAAEEGKPGPTKTTEKPASPPDKPSTTSPEKTATAAPRVAAADFERYDRNADGRLTREELKGTPYEDHFDEIDLNKDGKIDPKEFQAYIKKTMEKAAK